MSKGIPQGGATPIEIEIVIEIGKLPENDFDHDFDFDPDSERRWVENNNALVSRLLVLYTGNAPGYVRHFSFSKSCSRYLFAARTGLWSLFILNPPVGV